MVMKQNRSSSPSVRRSSVRALAVVAAGLLLASCGGGGGDDDGSSNDPSVWHFRGINAISDAPQVQFYVDDTSVATAEYGAATDYKAAHTGERPLKVAIRNASKLETADPGYTDIGDSETYDFQGPTDYTLVSAGTVANPRQFLITDTLRTDVEDNKIEYQVINAAPGSDAGGALDVLIAAPGAGIDVSQHVDDLEVGDYTEKNVLDVEVASGADEDDSRSTSMSFTIRQGGAVIYRSAAFTVAEQSRLLVMVVDNDGAAGSAPIKLMVFGGIAAGSASILPHYQDPSEVRFANVSAEVSPIDLIIGSSATDVFAPSVAYGEASDYSPLPAATYNAIGTPAGNAGVFLFVNSLATAVGRSYTEYGQGTIAEMRGLLFTDDRRAVPSEARFRFLNASKAATVSVYLTKRGTTLGDLDGESPPTPNVASLAYRSASSQLVLDGGSYDAYFTVSGETEVFLGPVPLDLADGTVQTLALAENAGGELELVPFNDARE